MHFGSGDATDLLVEERHQQGIASKYFLDLAVSDMTQGRIRFGASLFDQTVDLAVAEQLAEQPIARVENVDEGVRVGIRRDASSRCEIHLAVFDALQHLRHPLIHDVEGDASGGERLKQLPPNVGILAGVGRMHGGGELEVAQSRARWVGTPVPRPGLVTR